MNSLSIIDPAEKATSLSNMSNALPTQEHDVVTDPLLNEKSEVGLPVQLTNTRR